MGEESTYRIAKIFHHEQGNKWCLSPYSEQAESENSKTLHDVLSEQGSDEEEIKIIMKAMNPAVTTIHFWGDVINAIDRSPQKKDFEEKGLLNFDTNPKHFNDLQGEQKDIFAQIRKCSFIEGDEKKNCKNKIVTPWDVYQVIMSRASGTKENEQKGEKEEVAKEKNEQKEKGENREEETEEEKFDNSGSNILSLHAVAISTVMAVAILISSFFILVH